MSLHDTVLATLKAAKQVEPNLSEARALAVAVEVIGAGSTGKEAEQFREWFKVNSAILLKMLEGA